MKNSSSLSPGIECDSGKVWRLLDFPSLYVIFFFFPIWMSGEFFPLNLSSFIKIYLIIVLCNIFLKPGKLFCPVIFFLYFSNYFCSIYSSIFTVPFLVSIQILPSLSFIFFVFFLLCIHCDYVNLLLCQ